MILAATRAGLAAAGRHRALVATLWAANLTLALAAGVPGWLSLRSAIALLPEADGLGRADSLGVLIDLVELRPGLLPALALSAAGVVVLGLLVGAAVAGGTLETLASPDDRAFADRFGRGAGRFFARFLRAGLLAAGAASVLIVLVAFPLLAASGRLRESGRETPANAAVAVAVLLAGLLLLFVQLSLDAARIRLLRDDPRSVLPALRSGFGAVFRRPLRWGGVWGVNGLLLALAFVAFAGLRQALPATGGLALLLAQLFVLARCGLRVALWASESALLGNRLPLDAPTTPVAPAAEAGNRPGPAAPA